jgi:hypothetical protein
VPVEISTESVLLTGECASPAGCGGTKMR